MIDIYYSSKHKNKKVVLPTEYNELTGKQLIRIAALKSSGMKEDVAKLKLLQVLLNFTMLRFIMLKLFVKMSLLPLVEWAFQENTLTTQLIPVYKRLPWSKSYYGPKSTFDNLTLGEFHFSEVFYNELVNGESEDDKKAAMNNLVAVLYRRPKEKYNQKLDPEGDIRKPFNDNEVEYYAKKVAKWPLKVKLAIIFFYDGCRQHLVNLYEPVFEGDDGSDNDAGMFGVIRGLSGTKYGDIDKVEKILVHTALLELEYQIEEAKSLTPKA